MFCKPGTHSEKTPYHQQTFPTKFWMWHLSGIPHRLRTSRGDQPAVDPFVGRTHHPPVQGSPATGHITWASLGAHPPRELTRGSGNRNRRPSPQWFWGSMVICRGNTWFDAQLHRVPPACHRCSEDLWRGHSAPAPLETHEKGGKDVLALTGGSRNLFGVGFYPIH